MSVDLFETTLLFKPVKRRASEGLAKIKRWRPMCEHEGCHSKAKIEAYTYPLPNDDGSDDVVYFCGYHASHDGGFCPMCGYFVLGMDPDEFTLERHGLCSECLDQIRDEMGECDDDDYGFDYSYDDPYDDFDGDF